MAASCACLAAPARASLTLSAHRAGHSPRLQCVASSFNGSPVWSGKIAPQRQTSHSDCSTWQINCRMPSNGQGSERGPIEKPDRQMGKSGLALTAISLSLLQALAPLSIGNAPGGTFPLAGLGPQAAEAVLYSPDTAGKLPRTGEVALRRSIPPFNASMKTIQSSLEELFYLLRIPQRKPYGTMESNVKKAIQLATENKVAILAAVPDAESAKAAELYGQMMEGRGALEGLLAAVQLQDPDKIASRLVATLETVADLMTLQAPGLPYLVSNQFSELPRLTGRATVQFTIARADGTSFTVAEGGGPQATGVFEVVLDGYSAPLTSGNFVKLIQEGVYDGLPIKATSQAILGEAPAGKGTELPLELMPAGEEAPIYRTPLDVQDREIPVLPMSVFGSLCMSHSLDSETYSHPSQFFIYLYDRRNSGLGGLSFEEGQFSVFGYVIKGRDILSQLKTGDVIRSTKILSGQNKLVVPSRS